MLLAQFDSNYAANMTWGDVGTLYWMIRAEDLAARRFDRALSTWRLHELTGPGIHVVVPTAVDHLGNLRDGRRPEL